jgi:biopolymer transport protein TolR
MGRKMRRLAIKPQNPPNSDINVTPLIDVVLVLLIIFMVVTPLLEKNIDVRVPDTEKTETPDEVPDQLVVRITPEGDLKINYDKVTPEEYVDKLRAIIDKKRKPDDKVVFFIADDKTNYARLVTALDGAKQAGAVALGMMTELPDEGGGAAPAPAPAP